MTPEGRLLAKTIAAVKATGGCTIRLSFARGVARGWPDLLCLLPGGRLLFMELKAPGKRPSSLQLHRLDILRGLGYDAEWFDNADAARSAIERAIARAG